MRAEAMVRVRVQASTHLGDAMHLRAQHGEVRVRVRVRAGAGVRVRIRVRVGVQASTHLWDSMHLRAHHGEVFVRHAPDERGLPSLVTPDQ